MTEAEMEMRTVNLRLPKGHEPVWILLVSATPEPDPSGQERLAVSPQYQLLMDRMVERGDVGRLILAVTAVANRGLANMIAVALQGDPIDVGESWRPRPSRHQREPSEEGG